MQVQLATGTSVTTRTVAEFAERLGALRAENDVLIDVSELDEVDLTFVQLIDAHRNDRADGGRTLALSARDHEPITLLLSRCGYLEGADKSDIDFWTGEVSE